jgi:hypothetical protein
MTSSSDTGAVRLAYVPVTVSILVPVAVPVPAIDEAAPGAVCGLPVAALSPGTPEAAAAAAAVGASPEVLSALERLLAAVACHRREYPEAQAVATPWFGTVPEEAV